MHDYYIGQVFRTKESSVDDNGNPLNDGYIGYPPSVAGWVNNPNNNAILVELPDGSYQIQVKQLDDISITKANKLAEINRAYSSEVAAVKVGVPDDEIQTWDLQSLEAQAWLANNTAPTPFVDGIAQGRGVDRVILLNKILGKVTAYQAYVSVLTGKRQMYEDAIANAVSYSEINSIKWGEELPAPTPELDADIVLDEEPITENTNASFNE